MFKYPIVRQLALLLLIKLVAVFSIKAMFFSQPTIPDKKESTEKVSTHLVGDVSNNNWVTPNHHTYFVEDSL